MTVIINTTKKNVTGPTIRKSYPVWLRRKLWYRNDESIKIYIINLLLETIANNSKIKLFSLLNQKRTNQCWNKSFFKTSMLRQISKAIPSNRPPISMVQLWTLTSTVRRCGYLKIITGDRNRHQTDRWRFLSSTSRRKHNRK